MANKLAAKMSELAGYQHVSFHLYERERESKRERDDENGRRPIRKGLWLKRTPSL